MVRQVEICRPQITQQWNPPCLHSSWKTRSATTYDIENAPRLEFELARDWSDIFFDEYTNWETGEQGPPPDDHVATMRGRRLTCRVIRGDKEMERFKRQLWRIVHKLTVDEFVWVDRKTIEPKLFVARPIDRRAGFHACAWASKRRFNLLYHDLKPLDYFGPGGRDLPADIRQQILDYRAEQAEAAERRRRLARERRRMARLA